MKQRVRGGDLQRRRRRGEQALRVAAEAKGAGQLHAGVDAARVEADRGLEAPGAFVVAPGASQQQAQVDVGPGRGGPVVYRAAQVMFRLGQVAGPRQENAEVEVGVGEVLPDRQRGLDRGRGARSIAALAQHQPQQMQGVGFARIFLEDLAIGARGAAEVARTMGGHAFLQDARGLGCSHGLQGSSRPQSLVGVRLRQRSNAAAISGKTGSHGPAGG